jgi:hypothetical protein
LVYCAVDSEFAEKRFFHKGRSCGFQSRAPRKGDEPFALVARTNTRKLNLHFTKVFNATLKLDVSKVHECLI